MLMLSLYLHLLFPRGFYLLNLSAKILLSSFHLPQDLFVSTISSVVLTILLCKYNSLSFVLILSFNLHVGISSTLFSSRPVTTIPMYEYFTSLPLQVQVPSLLFFRTGKTGEQHKLWKSQLLIT